MSFLKIVHSFFFLLSGKFKTNTKKERIHNEHPSPNFNSYQLTFCPEYIIENPRHEAFYSYILQCLFLTDKAFSVFFLNIISMPYHASKINNNSWIFSTQFLFKFFQLYQICPFYIWFVCDQSSHFAFHYYVSLVSYSTTVPSSLFSVPFFVVRCLSHILDLANYCGLI